MVYCIVSGLSLMFFWCLCMAINVNVHYNGGLLPDIILLTQCYFHRGTRLNAMKRFCICSLRSHLNVLTSPPPNRGMLRSRCVLIFLLTTRCFCPHHHLGEVTVPPRRGTVGVGHASRSCVYDVAVQSVYVLLL